MQKKIVKKVVPKKVVKKVAKKTVSPKRRSPKPSKKVIPRKPSPVSPKRAKGKTVQQKMKGWSTTKPKKGVERQTMLENCGSECFLMPKELKYPVCSSPVKCERTCQGILSARARAKMVAGKYRNTKASPAKVSKHQEIAEFADYLAKKYNC